MKRNSFKLYIIIVGIIMVIGILLFENRLGIIMEESKAGISLLKTIKVTPQKMTIEDKNIDISMSIPQIHYKDEEVSRYINTYIRNSINTYVNNTRQESQLNKEDGKSNINITYHVVYEDKNMINLVIYKNIKENNKYIGQEKDSYIFDLNTGQRVYLPNLLENNHNYKEVIEEYIVSYRKEHNIKCSETISIDKNTNYYICDNGFKIYYKCSNKDRKSEYAEIKIPFDIFEKKVEIVKTDDVEANIDTQTITKNNKYINSVVNIPIIITDNKDIEREINKVIREDIMEFYIGVEEESRKYNKQLEGIVQFVVNVDYEITKNSSKILSMYIDYYKFSGGAHGYYEYVPYNIFMETGEFLTLEQLFKEDMNYKEVINQEIRNIIDSYEDDRKYVYQFTSIKDDQKYYIEDDNLVIFFDLYDIAPYASGIPTFSINIERIDHLIKDEYLDIFN